MPAAELSKYRVSVSDSWFDLESSYKLCVSTLPVVSNYTWKIFEGLRKGLGASYCRSKICNVVLCLSRRMRSVWCPYHNQIVLHACKASRPTVVVTSAS